MKKIIFIFFIVIIFFIFSYTIFADFDITTFLYKANEFFKLGIAKEIPENTGLKNFIHINESVLGHSYLYNFSEYKNEKLTSSETESIEYDILDFNGIKSLAILSIIKEKEYSNICLDLYNIKDLYWIYHNVLCFNNEKKLVFYQLFEFDYINKTRIRIDKNLEDSASSFNKKETKSFSELGLKFGKMIFFSNEINLLNFFDFNRFLNDKGNFSLHIPKINQYQKGKIQKVEKKSLNIKDKIYPVIYYKIIPDLSYFQMPFVDINKNCLELYFIENPLPILAKYIYKFEINKDSFIQIQELVDL